MYVFDPRSISDSLSEFYIVSGFTPTQINGFLPTMPKT